MFLLPRCATGLWGFNSVDLPRVIFFRFLFYLLCQIHSPSIYTVYIHSLRPAATLEEADLGLGYPTKPLIVQAAPLREAR